MKEILEDADLHPENCAERKKVDLILRKVVGMESEDKCNLVWKKVKLWMHDEDKKKELTEKLKADLHN